MNWICEGHIGETDADAARLYDNEKHTAVPAGVPAGRWIEPGLSGAPQGFFPGRRQLRNPSGMLSHRSPAGALPPLRRSRRRSRPIHTGQTPNDSVQVATDSDQVDAHQVDSDQDIAR